MPRAGVLIRNTAEPAMLFPFLIFVICLSWYDSENVKFAISAESLRKFMAKLEGELLPASPVEGIEKMFLMCRIQVVSKAQPL